MRRSFPFTITVLGAALMLSGAAFANSGIDRHELPPKVAAIKRQGQTAGFRLTLRLQPVSYDKVRVGLGKLASGVPRTGEYDTHLRLLAAGVKEGYLRHQFPELSGLTKGQAKEVEWEVFYGQGNDLKPGDRVDVISAWFGPTSKMNLGGQQYDYWHIFGMYDGPVQQKEEASVVTLPE